MLKLAFPELSTLLTPMLDNISRSGSFPEVWKRATTAIIQKAGKKDYTRPEAYQPIALLNTLGKVYKLIMARRLTQWAEMNHILAKGHLGDRKGLGTEHALFVLNRWVRTKWMEGKNLAALFLDVKSAYPSVQPTCLVQILKDLGCPAYLTLIISSFLSGRSTTFRLEDYTSPPFTVPFGLPQGSPLSVILYILYNNDLLLPSVSLDKDRISIGYVDNVVHLVASPTVPEAQQLIEKEGLRSLEWGLEHSAIFDTNKAQLFGSPNIKVSPHTSPWALAHYLRRMRLSGWVSSWTLTCHTLNILKN